MTTLSAAVPAHASNLIVTPAFTSGSNYPIPIAVDSENLLVTGGNGTTNLSVNRGQNGTVAASHAFGATVTAGWGGGGGGSISATDGTTTVNPTTSIKVPSGTLTDLGSGVAGLSQPLLGPFHFDYTSPGIDNPSDSGLAVGPLIPAGTVVLFFLFITAGFGNDTDSTDSLTLSGGADTNNTGAIANVDAPTAGSTFGTGDAGRSPAVWDSPTAFVTNLDMQLFVAFYHDGIANLGAADLYLHIMAPAS